MSLASLSFLFISSINLVYDLKHLLPFSFRLQLNRDKRERLKPDLSYRNRGFVLKTGNLKYGRNLNKYGWNLKYGRLTAETSFSLNYKYNVGCQRLRWCWKHFLWNKNSYGINWMLPCNQNHSVIPGGGWNKLTNLLDKMTFVLFTIITLSLSILYSIFYFIFSCIF